MKIKTGLLLPRSVIYPAISFDIVNGLRAGNNMIGDVVTENIGVGGDDKKIYAICEGMLLKGVNVVAGYVNPTTAEILQPLFAGANAIFIALDAGYHYPSRVNNFTHVFTVSLQGTLCCSALTRYAIDAGKRTFAYTSSYYDAGYRSAIAFADAMDNEAMIVHNHVANLSRKEFSLSPVESFLQAEKPDALIASYCGDMAQDFCTEFSRVDTPGGKELFVSPFMAEEEWLDKTPYPGVDMKACVPWARALNNVVNKEFTAAYYGDHSREANVFAVLGWEAGRLISIIQAADNTAAAIQLLEHAEFDSPRGMAKVDTAMHYLLTPVYNADVVKDDKTGNCRLIPGNTTEYADTERTRIIDHIKSFGGGYSSWHNAYACLDS